MECSTACNIINDQLVFRPGWTITAMECWERFEGAITVKVEYPAFNTDRDQVMGDNAANPYPEAFVAHASFHLLVHEMEDIVTLFKAIIRNITLEIHCHEDREYLRVKSTGWAPLHPHHIDGMRRWGNVDSDLKFGLV
jgi:hypothetical protein